MLIAGKAAHRKLLFQRLSHFQSWLVGALTPAGCYLRAHLSQLEIEWAAHFEENSREPRLCRKQGHAKHMFRLSIAALLLVLSSATAVCKDLALISHKANTSASVAMPELVKICKGQTDRWPDGKSVTFVTRDPAAPEMKIVLEKIYSMSKSDVIAAIASANHGRMNHPAIIVVDSDEALLNQVEGTPGAVGLVDVYSITGGVKVLKVGGKLPLEAGYALHGN
jgi:hypothetical protein